MRDANDMLKIISYMEEGWSYEVALQKSKVGVIKARELRKNNPEFNDLVLEFMRVRKENKKCKL